LDEVGVRDRAPIDTGKIQMNKMHTVVERLAPVIAAVIVAVAGAVLLHFTPLCRWPMMFLDGAQRQYCDIRDSADEGAHGYGYPNVGARTGLDMHLASVGDDQILFFSGQHQAEETGKEVALLLGANGGYLDRHGSYVGATGNWSLPASSMIEARARDASAGTVALLLKRLPPVN